MSDKKKSTEELLNESEIALANERRDHGMVRVAAKKAVDQRKASGYCVRNEVPSPRPK